MKIIILGSGTAASQQLGSNIPNRFPPGFLVELSDKTLLLLELSEGIRFRIEQAGYNYADIHHIAVSHAHPDHYAPLPYIQSVFCHGLWNKEKKRNTTITLYAPEQITSSLPILWGVHLPEMETTEFPWPKLVLQTMSNDGGPEQIGNAQLTAVAVRHGFGKTPALAYRLETPEGILVYSGDTGECEGIQKICRDADIFICEASARIGDTHSNDYGHLNPAQVGKICEQGNVKKVVLFHHTGLDTDEAIIEEVYQSSNFKGKVVVGKDFDVLKIKK